MRLIKVSRVFFFSLHGPTFFRSLCCLASPERTLYIPQLFKDTVGTLLLRCVARRLESESIAVELWSSSAVLRSLRYLQTALHDAECDL